MRRTVIVLSGLWLVFGLSPAQAQEAVTGAQSEARRRDHQAIDVEHLVLALLAPEDGIARAILGKVGAEPGLVASRIEDELRTVPKVTGAQPSPANRFMKLHIDLGAVSEDQMRSPDVAPNGKIDSEDRSEGGAAPDRQCQREYELRLVPHHLPAWPRRRLSGNRFAEVPAGIILALGDRFHRIGISFGDAAAGEKRGFHIGFIEHS